MAFYHYVYINTDLCLEIPNKEGGFEIYARHNPLVVGFFTPSGWEFPTSLYILKGITIKWFHKILAAPFRGPPGSLSLTYIYIIR